MENFLTPILKTKLQEVALLPEEPLLPKRVALSFYETVKSNPSRIHLIAEIKRASPSKGLINMEVNPVKQAKAYEEAGVSAISVLTDETFFKGSIEDLKQVATQVSLPVLCKDFIIHKKQLVRARNAGATMVLLIVSALDNEQLNALYQEALGLELEVLVEVHNLAELRRAEALNAKIIGVNNRNLDSFEVSLETSENLAHHQQLSESIYISESGFFTKDDVARVKEKYHGVLIGEALMREKNPQVAASNLKIDRTPKSGDVSVEG